MRYPRSAALLLVLCLLGARAATPPLASTNTVQLFNDTNLAGWSSWLVDSKRDDPRRVFTVTNGMIHISGDGLGYLATTNEFSDYRLVVEFKWGSRNTRWGDRIGKARDSGVFLHATGPDGNSHDGGGAFMAAIECNLFQGATGDLLLIRGKQADGRLIAPRVTARAARNRDADGWPWWQPDGEQVTLEVWGRVNWRGKSPTWKDELDYRGPHDVEQAYGGWNRLEITCDGASIEVRLNGTKVNEASSVWPQSGKILLQCEGAEIFFRRVTLMPLNKELGFSRNVFDVPKGMRFSTLGNRREIYKR